MDTIHHDITHKAIAEADERVAMPAEDPAMDGLQAYPNVTQDAVIEWVEENCRPVGRVNSKMTSHNLAERCGHDLRKRGIRGGVTNLAMKSAMELCGHEPVTAPVLHRHYRIAFGPHDPQD